MGWAEVTQGVPDWRTDSSCALLLTRHCRSCQKRHAKSTGATTKVACMAANAMLQHLVACPVRKAVFRVDASATHTISISVPLLTCQLSLTHHSIPHAFVLFLDLYAWEWPTSRACHSCFPQQRLGHGTACHTTVWCNVCIVQPSLFSG